MTKRTAERPGSWRTKKPLLVYFKPATHAALMRLSLEESARAGRRISASGVVEALVEKRLARAARKKKEGK